MQQKISACVMFMFLIANTVYCAPPIVAEIRPLIEKVRSPALTNRQEAVKSLLGLRESVAAELKRIVAEAEEGKTSSRSKAIALVLMGELGLIQCADVLDRQENWRSDTNDPEELASIMNGEDARLQRLIGYPAREARNRLAPGDNVVLSARRERASLDEYPCLRQALLGLQSEQGEQRRGAEGTILEWYQHICGSMKAILGPPSDSAYSDDVRMTSAHVLGEYRPLDTAILLWNIDLVDKEDMSRGYAQSLETEAADLQKPCAVALIKTGRRVGVYQCIARVETKPELSDETRRLIITALLAIDESKTRQELLRRLSSLEDASRWHGDEQSRLERLRRIKSVADVLEGQ